MFIFILAASFQRSKLIEMFVAFIPGNQIFFTNPDWTKTLSANNFLHFLFIWLLGKFKRFIILELFEHRPSPRWKRLLFATSNRNGELCVLFHKFLCTQNLGVAKLLNYISIDAKINANVWSISILRNDIPPTRILYYWKLN